MRATGLRFKYISIYILAILILNIFRYASTSAPGGSSSSAHDSGASNFFGTGYKLGQTDNDTEGLLNKIKLTLIKLVF